MLDAKVIARAAPVQQCEWTGQRERDVCNFLEYWRSRDLEPLASACGADLLSERLGFAPGEPTGVGDRVAHGDLLFEGQGARPTTVVTSFAERCGAHGDALPAAYFETSGAWGPLYGCRNLALGLSANPNRFECLPVGRMLEIALALTRRNGVRGFRLLYLWSEGRDSLARQHRAEIDRFRMRAGGEIDFKARSWQHVFERLAAADGEHAPALASLAANASPGESI